MTGFAGLFSAEPVDRGRADRLLADMARDITYASDDLVDSWIGERLGVTRVHHGVLNPQPQPIFNEDGSVCIVMTGEVFDYARERRSLEELGHRFQFAQNDAEYCLHLYEEDGPDALKKLNGSFALMIFDREDRELLIATDRVASHPVYYHQGSGRLVFATQLRPLLRDSRLPRRLDLRTVFEFFAVGTVLWDHTYFQDVKALPPATAVRISRGNTNSVRYWTPVQDRNHAGSRDQYAEALAEGIRRAVARKTRGDHRFGILLSGGLDSRAVIAGADGPLTAFTLGDFGNREVRIARQVSRASGAEHVFLKRQPDHYPDMVREAVVIGDGVQRFSHAHVLGATDIIREHCDVVLDAFGFDAWLKGLWAIERRFSILGRRFHSPQFLDIIDLTAIENWANLPGLRKLARFGRIFRAPHSQAAGELVRASLTDVLRQYPGLHPQDRFAFLKAGSFRSVGGYLMVQATRAHVPQRSAIFDNDLLDLALAIPPEYRARGRVLKQALHRLSPQLAGIPDSSTGLRADLPVWPEWILVSSGIALRDIGIWPEKRRSHPAHQDTSWPHMRELIRHNEKLGTLIAGTLHDPRCIDPDLFDMEIVDSQFRQHMAGATDCSTLLFWLRTCGMWHKDSEPA